MARQSISERNGKQKARQQEIRDGHRQARRPGRDDVARMALYWMITRAIAHSSEERLEMMQERIVKLLVAQGFNKAPPTPCSTTSSRSIGAATGRFGARFTS